MPYKAIIPGHFGYGRKMFLVFVPEDDFSVNFMAGDEFAFHFNPRFLAKVSLNHDTKHFTFTMVSHVIFIVRKLLIIANSEEHGAKRNMWLNFRSRKRKVLI